jgi:hypothetical protein
LVKELDTVVKEIATEVSRKKELGTVEERA